MRLVAASLALACAFPAEAQVTAHLAADIRPGAQGSGAFRFAVFGNALYFDANDGVHRGLFKYDGTQASFVADPGGTGSGVKLLTVWSGALYFQACDAAHGCELWSYDGNGATLAADVNPGPGHSFLSNLVAASHGLYFVAEDANGDREVYRFDGQSATMLADLWPGNTADPYELAVIDDVLYFGAADLAHGTELYKDDGTGLTMVDDIQSGQAGSFPHGMTGLNGAVYFQADDGVWGSELWRYDGISTSLVKDIQGGSVGSGPANFAAAGGLLYFSASDGSSGVELWSTDGTGPGTSLMADLDVGPGGSGPSWITPYGAGIAFAATDPVHGRELWFFDGATATLLADVRPGADGSNPADLSVLGSDLLFTADDGQTGDELWVTDGASTSEVADIWPGSGFGEPAGFTLFGRSLYFRARDPDHGAELWTTAPCSASPESCNGVDDDCNGIVDDGLPIVTYYRDADGDGFGNPMVPTQACAQPQGFVTDAADCDDANPAIHPSASEACNGVDDNCDGSIDEGVLLAWHPDLDNDNFGDRNTTILACVQPGGCFLVGDDCDDTVHEVYPGAPPVCDGRNDDCNDPNWPSLAGTNEADDDGDGYSECQGDCDDANPAVWFASSEVSGLGFANRITLTWPPPPQTGTFIAFDLVRSPSAADFMTAAVCLETADLDTTAVDAQAPAPGDLFFYVVRNRNGCGPGAVGPRNVRSCP